MNTLQQPMPSGLLAILMTLDAAAAVLLVYWTVGLVRLTTTSLRIPTARHGIALAAACPPTRSVSIIIPAHNEEVSIRPLIESLRAQDYPRFHVVLCLDRCTDQTTEIARSLITGDLRFTIVEIDRCPDGWAGKVNAAWTGVQSSAARDADLLLFADADTVFHPSCLSATVALMEHRRLDLLSLLSTLTTHRWFEILVQPAAGLELVRQYPIARANRREGRRRAFANGQFMMFTREAYEAVGGHEAVHNELLEDLALSRRIADAPGGPRPAGLFLADGMLTCRMYESWDQFRRGWKRIYTESAKCKVKRLRRAALVAGLFGAVLPVLAVGLLVLALVLVARSPESASARHHATVALWLSAGGLAAWLAVVAATHRIGRTPLWAAPGFAVGSWLVSRILAEAASDLKKGVATRWAGRDYVRTPR